MAQAMDYVYPGVSNKVMGTFAFHNPMNCDRIPTDTCRACRDGKV